MILDCNHDSLNFHCNYFAQQTHFDGNYWWIIVHHRFMYDFLMFLINENHSNTSHIGINSATTLPIIHNPYGRPFCFCFFISFHESKGCRTKRFYSRAGKMSICAMAALWEFGVKLVVWNTTAKLQMHKCERWIFCGCNCFVEKRMFSNSFVPIILK